MSVGTPSVSEQPASPAVSRVKLWRSPGRQKAGWTVEVVAGVTEEELDRLVELALGADRKIAAEAAQPGEEA